MSKLKEARAFIKETNKRAKQLSRKIEKLDDAGRYDEAVGYYQDRDDLYTEAYDTLASIIMRKEGADA